MQTQKGCFLSVWLIIGSFNFNSVESSSFLTSAYAKVAKWGADTSNQSYGEGRSNGQSLFTQRSEVMLRSGQNINKPNKNKEEVIYHYSMPVEKLKSIKVDASTKSPGFQDRFNPPPIFLFGDSKRNVPDLNQGNNHNHNHGNVGFVYPDTSKKVSYDSPISSYNPVASGIPDAPKYNFPGPTFPPFTNSKPLTDKAPPMGFKGPLSPENINSNDDMNYDDDNGGDNNNNNNKDPDDNGGYQYNPPSGGGYQYNPPTNKPTSDGYRYNPPTTPSPPLPPPAPSSPPKSNPSFYDHPKFPPYVYDHGDYHGDDHDDNHGDDHSDDHSNDHNNDDNGNLKDSIDHPPIFDHKPDHHHNHHHEMPPDNSNQQPQTDYQDYPMMDQQKPHMDKIPEYMDEDPTGKFNYPLFSSFYGHDHDHGHHVFHPVITTTTTTQAPEPEDENRVNKGHYSYYYLGRKLYYIPLYFSVYFIIYITVLILKSIARHKVNFVHDLDNVNKGRSFNSDSKPNVDELAEETTNAIHNFKRRYLAM